MEKVDIIGGGIAGLALAARLDPGRFDVTIHEQRPELPGVGTALAMWSGAQAALAELGLLETLKAAGARLASGALRDPSGHPMLAMQGNVLMGISRPGLLRMLDSAVPPSVTRITGKVAETPNNGALLVGADGVHSIVRRTAWGSRTQARPTPFLAVRGVIPSQPSPSDVGEYWGSATLFGLAPTGSGTNWYASFRSGLGPDQVDVEEALALTRHIFQHHSPAVQHVLGRQPRNIPRPKNLDNPADGPLRQGRHRAAGGCRPRHDAEPWQGSLRSPGRRSHPGKAPQRTAPQTSACGLQQATSTAHPATSDRIIADGEGGARRNHASAAGPLAQKRRTTSRHKAEEGANP